MKNLIDLNKKIEKELLIKEAVYSGNIAFEEMVKFYQIATDYDIKKMEEYIKKGSFKSVKKLIKKILGISLK